MRTFASVGKVSFRKLNNPLYLVVGKAPRRSEKILYVVYCKGVVVVI